MRICYGWSKQELSLSNDKRYYPEQLMHRVKKFLPSNDEANNPLQYLPLWIHVDNEHVRLFGLEEIALACKLAAIYHNGPTNNAPFDDGWEEDTLELEARARDLLIGDSSGDGSGAEGT
jgi:hypothetical protein